MKTHMGHGYQTVCGAPQLLVKQTTLDSDAVDCPACLWTTLANLMSQADRCANRLRIVTNDLINRAEYRIPDGHRDQGHDS